MDKISKNGVISAWWKNENNCSFSRCCKTLLVWNLSCVLKTWKFENVWRMQMGRICWQRRAERALAQAQTSVQDSEIFRCTLITITYFKPYFNLLIYRMIKRIYYLFITGKRTDKWTNDGRASDEVGKKEFRPVWNRYYQFSKKMHDVWVGWSR